MAAAGSRAPPLCELLWPRGAEARAAGPPGARGRAVAAGAAGAAAARAAARCAARDFLRAEIGGGAALPADMCDIVGAYAAAALSLGGLPALADVEPDPLRAGAWRLDVE